MPECHDPKGCVEARRLGTSREKSIRGSQNRNTRATLFLCLPPGLPSTLHGSNSTQGLKFSDKKKAVHAASMD